jgi:hypothetical protein
MILVVFFHQQFANLQQLIIDSQQLFERIVIDQHG